MKVKVWRGASSCFRATYIVNFIRSIVSVVFIGIGCIVRLCRVKSADQIDLPLLKRDPLPCDWMPVSPAAFEQKLRQPAHKRI